MYLASLFIKGVIGGLVMTLPVGPIGVMCLRRLLVKGAVAGLISGLGLATADAIYAGLAQFGLHYIHVALTDYKIWIRLGGGLFLLGLGVKIWLSPPRENSEAAVSTSGLAGDFISAMLVSLTNPSVILAFAALFTVLDLARVRDHAVLATVIAGVFIGSFLWWVILAAIFGPLSRKLSASTLLQVNRASALIIFGFGLLALLSLL